MPSSACDWSSDVCSSDRSEEHTSELQSRSDLVCRLLLEKKKNTSELQSRSELVSRLLLETENKRLWLKPRARRIFFNQPGSMFGGSICINSSLRPPVPPMAPNMPPPIAIVPPPLRERDIPMASNSSMKTTQPP